MDEFPPSEESPFPRTETEAEAAPPAELLESVAEASSVEPEVEVEPEQPFRAPEPQRSGPGRNPPPPPPSRPFQPASPAAVQGAIEEVNQILDTLRETLDQMEEVLETLELAERQKSADEQEIESLRRALRQMPGRPREGGPPPHRGR